jgi:hypothetical protein
MFGRPAAPFSSTDIGIFFSIDADGFSPPPISIGPFIAIRDSITRRRSSLISAAPIFISLPDRDITNITLAIITPIDTATAASTPGSTLASGADTIRFTNIAGRTQGAIAATGSIAFTSDTTTSAAMKTPGRRRRSLNFVDSSTAVIAIETATTDCSPPRCGKSLATRPEIETCRGEI